MGSYTYYSPTEQSIYDNGHSIGYSEPLWKGLDEDIKRILDTCEPAMKREDYFHSLSLNEITNRNDYLLRKNTFLQDELDQLDREFSRMIPVSKPLMCSHTNANEQSVSLVDDKSQQTLIELEQMRKQRRRQKESIENFRKTVKDLESRNREKELFLEQAKYQLSDVSKRTDLLSEENGFLRREIEDLRSMNSLLRSECHQLVENMQNVSQATEKMKEELKQNYDESLKEVLQQISGKSMSNCTMEREMQVNEQTRIYKHGAVQFTGSMDQTDFNTQNHPSAKDELLARENHILRDTCDLLKHELFSMKKMLMKQLSPRPSVHSTNTMNTKKYGRNKTHLQSNSGFIDSSTDSAPQKLIQKHGKKMHSKPSMLVEGQEYPEQYLRPSSAIHPVTTTADSLSETGTIIEKRLKTERIRENSSLTPSHYEKKLTAKPNESHYKRHLVLPYTGTESESSHPPDITFTDFDDKNLQLSGESLTKFGEHLDSVKVISEYEDVFDSAEDARAYFLRQKEERLKKENQSNSIQRSKPKFVSPPIPSRGYENKSQQHHGVEEDEQDLTNVHYDECDAAPLSQGKMNQSRSHPRRKEKSDGDEIEAIVEPLYPLESLSVSTENIPLIRTELQQSKELLRQQDDLLSTLERRIPHAFHPKISHGEPKYRKKVCQENKGVSHQSEDKPLASPGMEVRQLESDRQAMLQASLLEIQSDILNLRNELNDRQKSSFELDVSKIGELSKQDLSLSVSLVDIEDLESKERFDDQINSLKDSWDLWSKHLSTDMSGGFQACDNRLRTLETRFDDIIKLLQNREEKRTHDVVDHDKKLVKKKSSIPTHIKSPKPSQDKLKNIEKPKKNENSQNLIISHSKIDKPSSIEAKDENISMKKAVDNENDNDTDGFLSTTRLDSGIALDMPSDLLNDSTHLSVNSNINNEQVVTTLNPSSITDMNSKKSRLTSVLIQALPFSHYSRMSTQQEDEEDSQLRKEINSDIHVEHIKDGDNQPGEGNKNSESSPLADNEQLSHKSPNRKTLFERATEWFPDQVTLLDLNDSELCKIQSLVKPSNKLDGAKGVSNPTSHNQINQPLPINATSSSVAQSNSFIINNYNENSPEKESSNVYVPKDDSFLENPSINIPNKATHNLNTSTDVFTEVSEKVSPVKIAVHTETNLYNMEPDCEDNSFILNVTKSNQLFSKTSSTGPTKKDDHNLSTQIGESIEVLVNESPQKIAVEPDSNLQNMEPACVNNKSDVSFTKNTPSKIPLLDVSTLTTRMKEPHDTPLGIAKPNELNIGTGTLISTSPPSKLPLPVSSKSNTNLQDIIDTSPRIPDRRRRRKQEVKEDPSTKSLHRDFVSTSDSLDAEDENKPEFTELSKKPDHEMATGPKSNTKSMDSRELQYNPPAQIFSEKTLPSSVTPSQTSVKPSRIPRRKYDLESSFETLYEPRRLFRLPGVLPFREAQSRDDARKNGVEKLPILSSIADCEVPNREEEEDWLCSSASSTTSVDLSAPANLMRDSGKYNSNLRKRQGMGEDFGGDSTLSSRSMSPSLSISSDMDISGGAGSNLYSRFVLDNEVDLVPPIFLDKNVDQFGQTGSTEHSPDVVAQMLSNASLTYGYHMIHSSNDITNY